MLANLLFSIMLFFTGNYSGPEKPNYVLPVKDRIMFDDYSGWSTVSVDLNTVLANKQIKDGTMIIEFTQYITPAGHHKGIELNCKTGEYWIGTDKTFTTFTVDKSDTTSAMAVHKKWLCSYAKFGGGLR